MTSLQFNRSFLKTDVMFACLQLLVTFPSHHNFLIMTEGNPAVTSASCPSNPGCIMFGILQTSRYLKCSLTLWSASVGNSSLSHSLLACLSNLGGLRAKLIREKNKVKKILSSLSLFHIPHPIRQLVNIFLSFIFAMDELNRSPSCCP